MNLRCGIGLHNYFRFKDTKKCKACGKKKAVYTPFNNSRRQTPSAGWNEIDEVMG